MRTHFLWIGALSALSVLPHVAAAANCPTFTDQIVVAGSTAVEPLITAMSTALATQAAPTVIVYGKTGSCNGVNEVVLDNTPPAAACTTPGGCLTGTVQYWDVTTSKIVTCTLPAPTRVDVGLSDVAVDTCTGSLPPSGIVDRSGPVEPMLFVVPKASQQIAITAEEAYFVFGFGPPGQAKPWIDPNFLMVRNPSSGTEQVIAHEIGLAAPRWLGMDKGGSGGVVTGVSTSTNAEPTIGILGADVYDINRDKLTALAFQAFAQRGAFYPDSTATSFDKRNVRDGHYVNWGYLHMVTRVDSSNTQSPAAQRFTDWVAGNPTTPAAPFDITMLTIQAKLVPTCAMKVKRTSEGGQLSPFKPSTDCSTMFESLVGH